MAYEIPQQLQHKEKILFGLTFVQIAWTLLFGVIILVIFKSGMGLTSKFIVSIIPAMVGVLFIFFDVGKWTKYFFGFLKSRNNTLGSENMKKLVNISRIENSIVKSVNDVAVLQIKPLNFSIQTQDEKNTIIYGFQKFLNGLDFSVQFVVTTHNLNIDSYLDGLEKRSSNTELFSDFSVFMKELIKENEIRNRDFFLVIPKKTDLEIQCQLCKERLESIGLKVTRLTDKQLLEKFYTFFNGLQQKRESKNAVGDPLTYLIAPNQVKDMVDSLSVNDKQYRIICAVGYPRMVESGFLDKIIGSNDDFDISIHIEPFPIETMMVMMNRELQKQRADLYAEEKHHSINPSLEIKYKDTLKVLDDLQKGNKKLFNVSLYVNCKGKNQDELNLLTKKVEAELNALMIIPKIPYFRQAQGYKSMMPLAHDSLKIKRNITTDALSAFFPFTSPFLTLENGGVMLGLNKNKVPFIKDVFGLSNANGVVLATSGSGKSYFTKLLIARQMLNNTKVLIIDPQSEYVGLTGHCKGELITISRQSKTIINPLDLAGHDYVEKRLALMDMFKIMFGDLSEIQKSILDKAINETYARKGITAQSFKHKQMPILGDLYKVLVEMDKKATQMEKITYRALINRLYMYTEGVFGFLNKQSNIDFDKDFVCFNIGDMPKQVKPLIMFLILDYVYMKMKESKEKKLLVIDEAWSLLGKTEEASYIFEIVKTCRKFNMGLLLITQDVADLVNSKAGHAVLANSSYSLLLRQKPSVIDSVVKTFNLSQMEKEYLLTATQGKGVLIMDNEHQELQVVASPKEHEIITTNPNEIIQKERVPEEKTNVNINLDLEQGLFYGNNLDIEQKNYLANHGYKVGNFVPIGKPRQEECWVKENKVETLEHTFLVQNIKQELEKKFSKVNTTITKDVDILFTNKKGQNIAIEVETGMSYKKNKKKFKNKFNELRTKYKSRLIVVLTNKEFKRQYESNLAPTKVILRQEIPVLIHTQNKK